MSQNGSGVLSGFSRFLTSAFVRNVDEQKVESILREADAAIQNGANRYDIAEMLANPTRKVQGIADADSLVTPKAYQQLKTYCTQQGTSSQTFWSDLPVAKWSSEFLSHLEPEHAENIQKPENWVDHASGSTIRYFVEVNGKKYAAFVIEKPEYIDKKPQDIVVSLKACKTDAAVEAEIKRLFNENKEYLLGQDLNVEELESKSVNEVYGIASQRQSQLMQKLQREMRQIKPSGSLHPEYVQGFMIAEQESLISGQTYNMEVGNHQNYWPYWNNYRHALERVIEQMPQGHDRDTLQARLNYIYDHKTMGSSTSWTRTSDEQNIEYSMQMAVIKRSNKYDAHGQRVTMLKPADARSPLPQYALCFYQEKPVYADGEGKIYFDTPDLQDKHKQQPIQDSEGKIILLSDARVTKQTLSSADVELVGLRPLKTHEFARAKVQYNWSRSERIEIKPHDLGWTGHCHVESPLNVAGVNPKASHVTILNAALQADKPEAVYSNSDCWDAAGCLMTSSEEGGFVNQYGQRVRVDQEQFFGNRNDGHSTFKFVLKNGRNIELPLTLNALTTEKEEYPEYMAPSLLRWNVENKTDSGEFTGTFKRNPLLATIGGSKARNEDMLTIRLPADAKSFSMVTEGFTFSDEGVVTYVDKSPVYLDASQDQFVQIFQNVPNRGASRELIVYELNAAQKKLKITTYAVAENGQRTQKSSETSEYADIQITAETQYESEDTFHTHMLENPGLPEAQDTASDDPVWNYPCLGRNPTILKDVVQNENGVNYRYRLWQRDIETEGGPSAQRMYIIKRDPTGRIVDSCAVTPMEDFMFPYQRMVSAPIFKDPGTGRLAINKMALDYDFGVKATRRGFVVNPVLWERLAAPLHLAQTAAYGEEVSAIRTKEGHWFKMRHVDAYEAAKQSFLFLRDAVAGNLKPVLPPTLAEVVAGLNPEDMESGPGYSEGDDMPVSPVATAPVATHENTTTDVEPAVSVSDAVSAPANAVSEPAAPSQPLESVASSDVASEPSAAPLADATMAPASADASDVNVERVAA